MAEDMADDMADMTEDEDGQRMRMGREWAENGQRMGRGYGQRIPCYCFF